MQVVITKSFARIHETNLKKQGILALTFADPKDYEKIEQQDRISVTGLSSLAPGKPVQVTIHKADGQDAHHPGEPQHDGAADRVVQGWFRVECAELIRAVERGIIMTHQSIQDHLYKD